MRKTMRHILMERDRSFSRCTPKDVIARCAKPGCSDADTIRAALCANLCEIHIGVCATPNTWCLVSVRVLDRGRIIVARANAVRACCSAFPHPAFFVNFGDQPRIAVHGVSIGDHPALGGCMQRFLNRRGRVIRLLASKCRAQPRLVSHLKDRAQPIKLMTRAKTSTMSRRRGRTMSPWRGSRAIIKSLSKNATP